MKKRVLTMLLALVMALGLVVPALAADEFEAEAPVAPVEEEAPAAPVEEEAEEPAPVAVAAEQPADEPAPVAAATSGTCGANGDNLKWSFSDDGTLTISGTGPMKDYYPYFDGDKPQEYAPWDGDRWDDPLSGIVKKIVIESGVTSIGDEAFGCCFEATSVTIPDTVTSIGQGAFHDCRSLTQVTIPEGVTSIGQGAFRDCGSLTQVTIPGSVAAIDQYTFTGCALTQVTIPEGVASIGPMAFYECRDLAQVDVPSTVKEIYAGAFDYCAATLNITIRNPRCELAKAPEPGMEGTLAYCYKTVTIHGYPGSTAEAYVEKENKRAAESSGYNGTPPYAFVPLSDPAPTATPKPTATPTPKPTATPTPKPTATPEPTATPVPTPPPGYSDPLFVLGDKSGITGYSYIGIGSMQRFAIGLATDYILTSEQANVGEIQYYFDPQTGVVTGEVAVSYTGPSPLTVTVTKVPGSYPAPLKINYDPIGLLKDADAAPKYAMPGYVFSIDVNDGYEIIPDDENFTILDDSVGASGRVLQIFVLESATELHIRSKAPATPPPTPTPKPTATPGPDVTPTPKPTATPKPDVTPTPAPAPSPEPEVPAAPKSGTGWVEAEDGSIYFYKDNQLKKGFWVGKTDGASKWDGNWYYVGADGKLATGMQYIDDLHGGFGWYYLQPTNKNGEIGKMLTGWQYVGGQYGTCYFSTKSGSSGKCTYSSALGDPGGANWGK